MNKKLWWIQDWGTYTCSTAVFCGYTIPEITKIIEKSKIIKEEVKELWKNDAVNMNGIVESKQGVVWRNKGYTLLYLPKIEDTWDLWETVMHECMHLVIYQLGQQKLFINASTNSIEEEALAYQQEYLFRAIRRKIQDFIYKKPKKKKK